MRSGLCSCWHGERAAGPSDAVSTLMCGTKIFVSCAVMHLRANFCRLAALLDGCEPPENMQRCFANNYDIEAR